MLFGGLTIATNGFSMFFLFCYHRFQWFSMVPDHWSNDAMVSMDRCGPLWALGSPRHLPIRTLFALYDHIYEVSLGCRTLALLAEYQVSPFQGGFLNKLTHLCYILLCVTLTKGFGFLWDHVGCQHTPPHTNVGCEKSYNG